MGEAAAIVGRETDELNLNVGLAFVRWGGFEANAALKTVIDRGAGKVAFQIAEIYGYRGEVDQAFAWLERAA